MKALSLLKRAAVIAVLVFALLIVVIGMLFVVPGLLLAISVSQGRKTAWREFKQFVEELMA